MIRELFVELSEELLAAAIDYIYAAFEQPPRRSCSCVPYDAPTSCTAGVCK